MAITASEQRAISKAMNLDLAAQVERVRYGVSTVPSQSEPGVRWTVIQRVDGDRHRTDPFPDHPSSATLTSGRQHRRRPLVRVAPLFFEHHQTNSVAAALWRASMPRGAPALHRLSLFELLLAIGCLAMSGTAAMVLVRLYG